MLSKLKLIIIIGLALALNVRAQTFNIVLGRPTDNSVTASILFSTPVQIYLEYGTNSGIYTSNTSQVATTLGEPIEVKMNSLMAETRYFYRVRYKNASEATYKQSDEYQFITQRKRGSSFTFTVESDPHPYDKKCYQPLWDICLQNQLKDQPDFMFDLGDTFGNDHIASTITSEQTKQLMLNLRPIFGNICHSVPFFFCQGNHEGESGYYLLQTPPNNIATYETLMRKKYYPNPYPDSFYTGNTDSEGFGMNQPQNYYAFEWGDALFVVVDSYRYYTISAKPRNWEWTIGKTQYDWLKRTLESSTAKYKIVFTHHILGETRGATVVAKTFEWGGLDNGTNKFSQNRPGWEMPIHQLMLKNNVNLFIQGHDHIYAVEELDKLVYQTMPMPSDSSYKIGMTDNGSAFTGIKMKGSGHLRVTVNSDSLKVDFVNALLPKDETISSKNGDIVHSYFIKSNAINAINNVSLKPENQLCTVFSNPSQENIQVRFNKTLYGRTILTLVSIEGEVISSKIINNSIETGESHFIATKDNLGQALNPGVYLLSVKNNGTSQVLKTLIQ